MSSTQASHVQEFRITFLVTVPEKTPENDKIYVCGSHSKLGKWNIPGMELTKIGPHQYQGSFLFKKHTLIHFKFNRGSWQTVEKDADFHERPDRSLYIKKGQVIHYRVETWGDMGKPLLPMKHTLSGIIKRHVDFPARLLKNKRKIWVYLPPSYPTNKKKKYPVLYVHDGNNVFDRATAFLGVEWELDETTERLIQEKKIREIIIVAIENTIGRQDEYTHVSMKSQGGGGKADEYADFIINDLKPFIDKNYRTLTDRQYTAIMGSSLGGLVSLYIGWKYGHVFSMAGVVSPSVWWGHRDIIRFIKKTVKPELKIWLDIGTLEGKLDEEKDDKTVSFAVRDVRLLRDTLISLGFRLNQDLGYMEAEGEEHNEAAWAKRVDKILLFFFGSQAKSGVLKKYLKL